MFGCVCGYMISFTFRSMNMRNAMSVIIMLISIMSFLLILGWPKRICVMLPLFSVGLVSFFLFFWAVYFLRCSDFCMVDGCVFFLAGFFLFFTMIITMLFVLCMFYMFLDWMVAPCGFEPQSQGPGPCMITATLGGCV